MKKKKCDICGLKFTKQGLKVHRNSKRCLRMKDLRPLWEEAYELRQKLVDQGKATVTKNVINALERRNSLEVVGYQKEDTSFVMTDTGGQIVTEHWLYKWVVDLYYQHLRTGKSQEFYDKIKYLAALSGQRRNELIGLYVLESLGNGN